MIYVLSGLLAGLYAAMVIGFWRDVRRFGKWKEAIGREVHMFAMDGVSIYAALMVAYFAANDWYGFTLPLFSQGQLMSWQATLLAVACAVTSLSIGYFNGRERFLTPTYAGPREATLRFLASRQIIEAAEVAHALKVMQQHEARQSAGRTIEAEAREVGK
ncbi:hypothetical protein P3818_26085 [Pseudomonas aeruginosa]|uniref:hypothetical protein n=1 Tax=Pseudomonas aeruginosa TaxID=287 RepID=UPI00069062BD|nr:hypothetical protein [Pseudomonas aeruginosa]MDP5793218.1 hypothetical protein [Pseudomonas aeruginosa]MDP5975019.1 hypothetical protein [Pseudomonas aeruginosa]HBO6814849.1 hypothetical protein [Pseudomonas aeruginosa]